MFQPSVHDLDLLRIRLILEERKRRKKGSPLLRRIAELFGVRPKNVSQAQAQAQTLNTSKYRPHPGLKNTARILHRRSIRQARW